MTISLIFDLLTKISIHPKSSEAVFPPNNFVFDYFLKDHLGNIRAVVSNEITEHNYAATMEIQNAPAEEQLFYNIPSTREPVPANYPNDPTYSPNQKVSDLNAAENKPIGHAKVLSVVRGDKIDIDTKYFFDGNPFVQSTLRPIEDILTQLAGIFFMNPPATIAGAGQEINQLWANETFLNNSDISGFLSAAFDQADQNNAGLPRAFLIHIFFNKDFKFNPIASGLLQASTPDQLGDLAILDLKMPEDGYLYIYVSNETDKNVEFDNLQISHTSNFLIETNDYYPYGLLFANTSALDVTPQKYKYNGKELQTDLRYNVLDYGARHYDPVIGRWLQVDRKAEKYFSFSPYNYTNNNPAIFIDPNGDSTMYMNTAGAVLSRSSDNLPNCVTVVKNENLFKVVMSMAELMNTDKNGNDFNSMIRNSSDENYYTDEYKKFYAENENDEYKGMDYIPRDGKGPLIKEHSALLVNGHISNEFQDNNGKPDGSNHYSHSIHTHPNEGRLTYQDGGRAEYEKGEKSMGAISDGKFIGDKRNTNHLPGSGKFDIVITKDVIRFYNNTKVYEFKYDEIYKKK